MEESNQNESYDTVINELITQIQNEMRNIRFFQSNQPNYQDERGNVYDALTETVRSHKLDYCSSEKLQPEKHLFEELSKDLINFKDLVQKTIVLIKEDNEEIMRLKKNIQQLEKMLEVTETGEEQTRMIHTIKTIEQNINQRFMKEKADLRTTINTLYPDNSDLQNLIANMIDSYYREGADKYLKLDYSETILENIELLKRANILEVHPTDSLQIKFPELI